MRSRSYRRHHRERVIAKRISIARNMQYGQDFFVNGWGSQPGRFDTYNFTCDCGMCRLQKQKYRQTRHLESKLWET